MDQRAHGEFSLNAISSRGCPFHCNWCAKPVFGSHYHVRSPQSVACEMQVLKNRFRPDHLWFADDIFALSPSWTYAVRRRRGRALGADPVQDAVALRPDDAQHGFGAAAGRLRRSLDGRGIGVAEGARRDGQGDSRRADLSGA